MGNSIAPAKPTTETGHGGGACPSCGHEERFAAPAPSLLALFRRAPWTCAHAVIEQDALVDDVERCRCRHIAHAD